MTLSYTHPHIEWLIQNEKLDWLKFYTGNQAPSLVSGCLLARTLRILTSGIKSFSPQNVDFTFDWFFVIYRTHVQCTSYTHTHRPANGINCWKCNSFTQPYCRDFFSGNSSWLVDCDQEFRDLRREKHYRDLFLEKGVEKSTFCRKIIQEGGRQFSPLDHSDRLSSNMTVLSNFTVNRDRDIRWSWPTALVTKNSATGQVSRDRLRLGCWLFFWRRGPRWAAVWFKTNSKKVVKFG